MSDGNREVLEGVTRATSRGGWGDMTPSADHDRPSDRGHEGQGGPVLPDLGRGWRLSPLERARAALANLDPRSPRYLGTASRLVYRFRMRHRLAESEALELRADALSLRWRKGNGLEFRLLVALMRSPDLAGEVFAELAPADFVSVPYAALFAAWCAHGVPAPEVAAALLEGRRLVPDLSPEWWAGELRANLAEMLKRRGRWAERHGAALAGTSGETGPKPGAHVKTSTEPGAPASEDRPGTATAGGPDS